MTTHKPPSTTLPAVDPFPDFSAGDRALLSRWLWFYEGLRIGMWEPSTAAQRRLVSVCNGERAPENVHEAAYARYLEARGVLPPEAVIRLHWSRRVSSGAAALFWRNRERLAASRGRIADALLWPITILSDAEAARWLERWTADSFNTLSDTYRRTMDGKFLDGIVAGDPSTYPLVHRLFEGHTPSETWQSVRSALPDDSSYQEFVGHSQSLLSDLTSVVGLPVLTFTQEGYQRVSDLIGNLGFGQGYVADLLHYNAVELVGSSIAAVAVLLCWNEADTERFSALVGTLGVSAVASANPLMGVLTVVSLARAYSQTAHKGKRAPLLKGLGKGSLVSAAVYGVSGAVGGPAWVGLVTGLCVMKLAQDVRGEDVTSTVRKMQGALRKLPARLARAPFRFRTAATA